VQGDRTSRALVPAGQQGLAAFVARCPGVVAGLPAAALVCSTVTPPLAFQTAIADGTAMESSTRLATISGTLRSILAAERIALNFLQHLSGIASQTRRYVDAIAGFPAQLLDTRKTTP